MSRRNFLKWLFTVFAAIAGAGVSLYKLLLQPDTSATAPPAAANGPGAKPEAESAQPQTKPLVSTEPLLSFFILSDLHVSMYDDTTGKKLKMALDDITNFDTKVDTILLGGDLTDYGTEGEYKELKSILSAYKLPKLYGNMGNHDYYDIWIDKNGSFNTETAPNGKKDAQSRERFQKFFGYDKPYHDVRVNGYHLIMLSQEAYVQERPEVGEGAWYSDEQLNWFKAKLEENKDGKPIFVLIHQPLPPAGQDGGSHRLIRANAFRELLKPYPNVFVISGHTHQDFENGSPHYTKETFHWFVNASVGRTRTSPQDAGKMKSQGLYVQVYADRVVLRGREFTKKSWIAAANWTVPLETKKA